MIRWVLATSNQGKVREFQALLGGVPIEVAPLSHFGATLPEETGATFQENALLKARAAARATGQIALGDDSGLCVDALDGAPGLFSARYAGPGATDQDNRRKLLGALSDVPPEGRTAHFVAALALVAPGGEVLATSTGRCDGTILPVERGEGGFGYDPLFVPAGFEQSFAELPGALKDRLSHRGRALAELLEQPGLPTS